MQPSLFDMADLDHSLLGGDVTDLDFTPGASSPGAFLAPERWLAESSLPLTPHPHQTATFLKTWKAILDDGGEAGLVVKPTGTGKSVEIALHCRYAWEALGWRTLVWVHRDKLVKQLMGTLEFMGVHCVREQGSHCGRRAIEDSSTGMFARPVMAVVASAQTLHPGRIARWDRGMFGLAVRDEAHHITAKGDRRILAHFRAGSGGARLLGYTATPERADGSNLGEVFPAVFDQMTLPEAIGIGALVRPMFVKSDVKIDLRGISTRGGDYSDEELADRVSMRLGPIVKSVVKEAGDRKTVLFLPGVKCSKMAAEAINRHVLGDAWVPGENDVAKAVWGDRPGLDDILDDFDAGKFQYICNCDLLTEGWDCRSVRCVALCRATCSAALLAQMIGRGTRRDDANGKDHCLYIDFAWQTDRNRNKLVSPYGLVVPDGTATNLLEEMERQVQAMVEAGSGPVDPEAVRKAEELEKAKAARAAKAAAEAEEETGVVVTKADAKIKFDAFDPLAGAVIGKHNGEKVRKDLNAFKTMVSGKQAEYLVKLGMPEREVNLLTRDEASKCIDTLQVRKKHGLATYKQVKLLMRHGMPRTEAMGLRISEASEAIDALMSKVSRYAAKAAR
jgi:superfamily II DNA or RNA helicase